MPRTPRIDRPAVPGVTPPPTVLPAIAAFRRAIERGHRATTLPLVTLLEQVVGMAEVRATAVFVELGLPDRLERGPATSTELASDLDVDADHVDRLLRFLATRGLVTRRDDTFALSAASDLLRTGHPDSVRDWVLFLGSDWQWHAWEGLADGIRHPGTTPYEQVHGAPYFDDLAADEARGATFDAAMRATSRLQGDLLARALDLDGVATICDVGGGTGSVLVRLLRRNPDLRGTLLELPPVVERARDVVAQAGLADRIDLVAGDAFAAVPPGADRYLLSAVVHDWPDDGAVAILSRVREAMADRDARAIVVELELPDHDGASLERAYDLLMLVLGGGRERTRDELVALYARAGLALDEDVVLANGWHAHHLVRG